MNQPRCPDCGEIEIHPALHAEPPVCEFCERLVAHCDADPHGCGTTPAKDETWRDRPPLA